MTAKQASGKPAFPVPFSYSEPGINVRTYIATKAMAAMISSATHWDGQGDAEEIAKYAVKQADALIAELSKS